MTSCYLFFWMVSMKERIKSTHTVVRLLAPNNSVRVVQWMVKDVDSRHSLWSSRWLPGLFLIIVQHHRCPGLGDWTLTMVKNRTKKRYISYSTYHLVLIGDGYHSKQSGGKPYPEMVVTMTSLPQSTNRHTDSQWRTTTLSSFGRGGIVGHTTS